MSDGQAKKGGEVGKNGEFYKGGQFLPSTQLPKRGAQKRVKGSGLVLVAPGVREVAPEGMAAIFARVNLFVKVENGVLVPAFPADHPSFTYYFQGYAEFAALVERYNAGERFYAVA